ncbi:hypothetical protein ABLE91_05695 [Aquabacter sp. CN5-332]|uniref:hypothetical protein n=1 Tax=Aquabacter sp. CN5-332 TaxID=3156608 RepID=UPI0032B5014B
MACRSCQEARSAVNRTARAAVSGDLRGAASGLKDTATHLATKAKDEAARVRAMVMRRK